MLLQWVAAILDRDLRALRREVEAYPDDAALWQEVPGISNVAGTLVLHLAGNVQHYLGTVLGGTGYVRDRPAEFATRNVPRPELVQQIEAARSAVKAALLSRTPLEMTAEYPEPVAGSRVAVGDYLIHLSTHFAYHLGQVDYHRRMVTGAAVAVDAMRPSELSSTR
jgi:hypothetical protein